MTTVNKENFFYKLIYINIALIILFQEFTLVKSSITLISFIDEIILIGIYSITTIHALKEKNNKVYVLTTLAPLLSIVYSIFAYLLIFNETNYKNITIQSFINLKYFIFFSFFYYTQNKKNPIDISKILNLTVIISIIGLIFNILSPNQFIFSEAIWQIERNRLVGFQFKPNDLAIFLSLSTCYYLFLYKNILSRFILLAIISGILISGSRTGILILTLILISYLIYNKKIKTIITATLIALMLALYYNEEIINSFFFKETILNMIQFTQIEHTQYIRALMIYLSAVIAFDFFPLGTGAGSFGTIMSSGSITYEYLGVSNDYFFVNMKGVFDSGLASTLGEYGFIGLVIIYFSVFKTISTTIKDGHITWTLFICIIILSLTQPFISYHVNAISFLLVIFSIKFKSSKNCILEKKSESNNTQ